MENLSKFSQNIYGSVGQATSNVEGDFNITGDINVNHSDSLADITKELEEILDKLNNQNLAAAQKSALQSANRLPALRISQAVELAINNNPTLRQRFISAFSAISWETIKLVFAPAEIPIEGIRAWLNPNS